MDTRSNWSADWATNLFPTAVDPVKVSFAVVGRR